MLKAKEKNKEDQDKVDRRIKIIKTKKNHFFAPVFFVFFEDLYEEDFLAVIY